MSRNSVGLWVIAFGLALAGALPAGATVRTATYRWAPATGPVAGYLLYASVNGSADEPYLYVRQPNAVIQVDSGDLVVVSVAAYDALGRLGPRSDDSPSLRLCPGDFDGDEVIESTDVNRVRGCINHAATSACAGADMNDDGYVSVSDYVALEVGADACPALPPQAGCAGDMNGDGVISLSDVFAVKSCLGLNPQGDCTFADFDGSGFVSNTDVVLASRAVGTVACSQ